MARLRILTVFFAMLAFGLPVSAAGQGDGNPPENNDPNAPGGPQGGGGRREGQGPGPQWGGGRGGQFQSLINNFLGGHGTQLSGDNMAVMASRMAGVEVDNKANSKVDALPLGANRSLVVNVPVGGIDCYSLSRRGFKVETVFKLTDEQAKAVNDLRDEYKNEQRKLEEELLAQQKVLAGKVVQLRLKYEQRANDILTGAEKETKKKLDVLAEETNAKAFTAATGTLADYENPDFTKSRQIFVEIHQAAKKLFEDAQAKALELLPAESRNIVEAAFKEQQAQQPPASGPGWQGGGQPQRIHRGGGGNANQPGDAVKPPQPPEQF